MLTFGEFARGLFHTLVLNGAALGTAVLLARRYFPRRYLAERFQVTALLWAALVAFPTLALGALGLLSRGWLLALEVGLFALAFAVTPGFGPRPLTPAAHPGPFAWIAGALFAVMALADATYALEHPPLSWDSLYYHLPLSVHWIQTGSLQPLYLPDAPYQAYFPGTGDLFTVWAMLPFSNDLLVGLVNLPLLALGAVAVYRIAILCGADPRLARWVPPLYLFTPAVARYATTSYVEPAMNAFVLSAVVHLLEYRRERRGDAIPLFGLALGLLVGTKYTALGYAAVLAVAMGVLLWRRRLGDVSPLRLSLMVAFLLFGGYWYFRNALLTGNPFYPTPVSLLGAGLFEGIPKTFAGETLDAGYLVLHGILDAARAGDLLDVVLGNAHRFSYELGLGPKVGALGLASVAGARWLARRRAVSEHPDAALALALAFLFLLLFLATPLWRVEWLAVNVRFAAPALALACALAAAFASAAKIPERRFAAAVALCATPDLLVLLLGVHDVTRVVWALAATPLALLAARPRTVALPMRRHWRWLTLGLAGLTLGLALLAGGYAVHRWREKRRHHHYATEWDLHETFAQRYASAWHWLDRNVRGRERLATYGGEYLYPMYGPRLERRVFYVDVNDEDGRATHAYPRGATRANPDPDRWVRNLRRRSIHWVAILRPWWSPRFPIEAGWADARPGLFRPAYRDETARIYEFLGRVP